MDFSSSTPQAGPSYIPSYPDRLTVAHRDDTGSLTSSPADPEVLRARAARRTQISKKAERWSDKMMEEIIDLSSFSKAISFLTPQQYRDVIHERHLNHMCSYPPCPNPPAADYTSHRRFKISTSTRTIREKEGNDDEGFCSKLCGRRSAWVLDRLEEVSVWERAGKGGLPLLEDIEANNPDTATPARPPMTALQGKLHSSGSPRAAVTTSPTEKFASSATTLQNGPATANTPNIMSQLNSLGQVSSMVSQLTIHERPTQAPIASNNSSSSQGSPHEVPAMTSSSLHPQILVSPAISNPTSPSSPPQANSKRKDSSLFPTPARLATSIVSASRNMGPMPQLEPDPEDQEDEGKDWGEAEMGLEWGEEDEEMKGLFEEARMARDLLEEEKGDEDMG